MTVPIQIQRLPKRKKPAKLRSLFWVIAVPCIAIFCAGLIASCTPNPVFPL